MQLLTSQEAADIIGVSRVRLTQVLKPDKRIKDPRGGLSRLLFKRSTVENYANRILTIAERKRKKLLAIELEVPRPTEKHLTLTEASEFLQVTKGIIKHNVKCTTVMKGTRAHRFYTKADLYKLPKDAKARPKGPAGRKESMSCTKCGKTFKGRPLLETVCPACIRGDISEKDIDPYKVMLKPKKQLHRCCPICKRMNLLEEQYMCTECRANYYTPEVCEGFEYVCP